MKIKKEVILDLKKLVKHLSIIVLSIILGAVLAHYSLILFTRHNSHRTVPEFKGLVIDEANMLAKKQKLNIIINDSLYAPMYEGGMVLDQLPKAGVEVKPGRTIYVTINAFGVKMVSVPYVAGRSLRQAKNMLEVAGLQIEKLVYRPDMATNYVLAQYCDKIQISESSNHEAVVGSGVILHVGMSHDNRTAVVPQLIGMTLREAKSRLWESGLNIGQVKMPSDATIDNQAKARVYSQSTSRGRNITLGNSISIELTLDNKKVDDILSGLTKADKDVAKYQAYVEDSLSKAIVVERSTLVEEPTLEPEVETPQQVVVESDSADSFFE